MRANRLAAAAVACVLWTVAAAGPAAAAGPRGTASLHHRAEAVLARFSAALRLLWAELWALRAAPGPVKTGATGSTNSPVPACEDGSLRAGHCADPDGSS